MDVLLAAAVLVQGTAEALVLVGAGPGIGAGLGTVVLLALAVLIRRRLPEAALVLAFAAFIVAGLDSEYTEHIVGPFAVLLLALVDIGGRLRGRRHVAGLVVAAVLVLVGTATDDYLDAPGEAIFTLVLVAWGPLSLGRFLRGRADLNRALREKSERLERDREERSRQAVAEERARIASELHDAISHALSGMVIQAAGARRSLPAHPDRARAAFAAVEESGREALSEMRLLLGVLRREDAEIALAPHPGLAHLDALVARVREGGLAVDVEVEGEHAPLAAGLDLTAYRVVQEALTSAASHGGAGRARVRLRFGADRLEIEVADDGAPATGRTLLGMRERLTIYGGELRESSQPGTGHLVRARIPLAGVPA